MFPSSQVLKRKYKFKADDCVTDFTYKKLKMDLIASAPMFPGYFLEYYIRRGFCSYKPKVIPIKRVNVSFEDPNLIIFTVDTHKYQGSTNICECKDDHASGSDPISLYYKIRHFYAESKPNPEEFYEGSIWFSLQREGPVIVDNCITHITYSTSSLGILCDIQFESFTFYFSSSESKTNKRIFAPRNFDDAYRLKMHISIPESGSHFSDTPNFELDTTLGHIEKKHLYLKREKDIKTINVRANFFPLKITIDHDMDENGESTKMYKQTREFFKLIPVKLLFGTPVDEYNNLKIVSVENKRNHTKEMREEISEELLEGMQIYEHLDSDICWLLDKSKILRDHTTKSIVRLKLCGGLFLQLYLIISPSMFQSLDYFMQTTSVEIENMLFLRSYIFSPEDLLGHFKIATASFTVYPAAKDKPFQSYDLGVISGTVPDMFDWTVKWQDPLTEDPSTTYIGKLPGLIVAMHLPSFRNQNAFFNMNNAKEIVLQGVSKKTAQIFHAILSGKCVLGGELPNDWDNVWINNFATFYPDVNDEDKCHIFVRTLFELIHITDYFIWEDMKVILQKYVFLAVLPKKIYPQLYDRSLMHDFGIEPDEKKPESRVLHNFAFKLRLTEEVLYCALYARKYNSTHGFEDFFTEILAGNWIDIDHLETLDYAKEITKGTKQYTFLHDKTAFEYVKNCMNDEVQSPVATATPPQTPSNQSLFTPESKRGHESEEESDDSVDPDDNPMWDTSRWNKEDRVPDSNPGSNSMIKSNRSEMDTREKGNQVIAETQKV